MPKKTKNITLDNLAAMVAKGFEDTATKADIIRLEDKINHLEQGQEDIKLRLDNVAYRFEVKELERRVERLETKAGIHH